MVLKQMKKVIIILVKKAQDIVKKNYFCSLAPLLLSLPQPK